MATRDWTPAEIADFWQHNTSDFAGDKTAKVIVRLVRKYIGQSVLDVGAGSGALLRELPDAVGIDIVPRGERIGQGCITDIPYPNSGFDTVFACDMLEHLTDSQLTDGLREVARVLAPGGHLIGVVPYMEDLSKSRVYCPHCHSEFHRWGHMRTFTIGSLRRRLSAEGLTEVLGDVLPLGLMGEHGWWRYWRLAVKLHLISESDVMNNMRLLMVARKG